MDDPVADLAKVSSRVCFVCSTQLRVGEGRQVPPATEAASTGVTRHWFCERDAATWRRERQLAAQPAAAAAPEVPEAVVSRCCVVTSEPPPAGVACNYMMVACKLPGYLQLSNVDTVEEKLRLLAAGAFYSFNAALPDRPFCLSETQAGRPLYLCAIQGDSEPGRQSSRFVRRSVLPP